MLLNFWATWCIPCREEIPVLNAMQHDLEARGLKIVGASLEDTADGVNSYQKEVRKFEYQVVVGGSEAQARFGGTPLPTTYLIDRDGRIRQKIIGARDRGVQIRPGSPVAAQGYSASEGEHDRWHGGGPVGAGNRSSASDRPCAAPCGRAGDHHRW